MQKNIGMILKCSCTDINNIIFTYHNFGWSESKVGIVLMPDLFNTTYLGRDRVTVLGEDGRG